MAYQSLHDRLKGPVVTALKKQLKEDNTYALPRIEKVIVNVGINKMRMDSKEQQEYIVDSLMKITGQKPILTRAKKAISNFKIRENMVVGAVVTLRGQKMEAFLDRLLSYALPRIRDFRGLTTKLDGHGNYSIGIRDHSIFPEVPPADAKQIFGVQVQIATTAKDDESARALLKEMGVPFRPEKKKEEDTGKKEEESGKRKEEAGKDEEKEKDDEEEKRGAGLRPVDGGGKEKEEKEDSSVDLDSDSPNT